MIQIMTIMTTLDTDHVKYTVTHDTDHDDT